LKETTETWEYRLSSTYQRKEMFRIQFESGLIKPIFLEGCGSGDSLMLQGFKNGSECVSVVQVDYSQK
jgi:hypothetical protein